MIGQRIKVKSDGTTAGTEIMDGDTGEQIDCMAFELCMQAFGIPVISMTFPVSEVSLDLVKDRDITKEEYREWLTLAHPRSYMTVSPDMRSNEFQMEHADKEIGHLERRLESLKKRKHIEEARVSRLKFKQEKVTT